MEKLNWNNLKEFRCPKCMTSLEEKRLFTCRNCGFMISKGKFFDLGGVKINYTKEATQLLKKRAEKIKKKQKAKYRIITRRKDIWDIPDNF